MISIFRVNECISSYSSIRYRRKSWDIPILCVLPFIQNKSAFLRSLNLSVIRLFNIFIENLLRNSEVICFLESINIFNCSFCSSINFIMNLLFSWIKVIISFISKNIFYNLYLLLKFVGNSFFNVWDSKLTAEGFIKKV